LEEVKGSSGVVHDRIAVRHNCLVTDVDPRVLASKRAAYIAAHTERRLREKTTFGSAHSAELSFEELRAFVTDVWRREGRAEPLIVTAVESLPLAAREQLGDVAGYAKWSLPPPWFPQVMTAYIDVTIEGRNRLMALHETAHLLCDTADEAAGHGDRWAETLERLVGTYLGDLLGSLWRAEFDWWTRKAAEKIAENPLWLAS
jgi:hypothetical protein